MHELLSPAGDFASLRQAVINGCDAVYVGGIKFGARKYAPNFTNEELIKAIHYCHLYNVKIYVTVNTLIYDNELTEALKYIEFLYKNEVDAIIMQDIGLIKLVREMFPDLEIHASTQLHNHTKEGLELLKDLQVKRAVLARELTIDEINNLDVDIEKEVFIHGALCICYSGQCLFSSILLNRSGNRGSCAGFCRLPYDLYKNNELIKTTGKYLLSPKELNTSSSLNKILESNIASLKIEGRMKSPTYVGFVTRFYRRIIDNYYKYKKIIIDNEDIKKLMILYNRDFTEGYLFHKNNNSLMNIQSPNHQGLEIGQVIEVDKKKIKIKLLEELNQNDGIRFSENNNGGIVNFLYNDKGLLVKTAPKNSIIYLDNKYGITTKCKFLKTSDIKLTKEFEDLQDIKIPINIKVIAKVNCPLEIEMIKDNIVVKKSSSIIEEASNSPTLKEMIIKQTTKLGNTPFICNNIKVITDDNIFIPVKTLNELRREVTELLIDKLSSRPKVRRINSVLNKKLPFTKKNFSLNVLVVNEEQLKTILKVKDKVNRIYVTEETLYEKYKNLSNIYLKLPRVIKNKKNYQNSNLLVSELGGIKRYNSTNNIITDTYLNVANHAMIDYLLEHDVKTVTLSLELTNQDIKDIIDNYQTPPDLEIILYTRVELMIMKHCMLNHLVKEEKTCNLCKENNYYLKDRNNAMYPLIHNNCLTTILNSETTNRLDSLKTYMNMNISSYRLEFFNEDRETILKLVSECYSVLQETN